ncbi:MAG: iron-containing redox enzyme family protein [Kibdelosporangium sp.]
MRLPRPRGPLSAGMVTALRHPCPYELALAHVRPADAGLVHDEDFQLALWISYELAYRGFDDVDDTWEWAPSLVAGRAVLEGRWLAALRQLVDHPGTVEPKHTPGALAELVAADDGPPLAGYLQRQATVEQFRDFVAARSVYHLKEADPHSWGIPRLDGRAKAALVEIQADEYGGGQVEWMHSELFRATMRALGLNDTYGHYIDQVPAVVFAVSNTMSMFGLQRRFTGALLGHLAAFEMTSSLPNRRYGNGLRRLGFDTEATRFYDEHVEADAVHEQIAAHDLCGSYAEQHPDKAGDILFGAACALAVEAQFATYLLDYWNQGRSVLATDLTPAA